MRWLLLVVLLIFQSPVLAHKASDSYLNLQVVGTQVQGQWDIALRDLDYALGLDSNDDGVLTWGEVRNHEKEVVSYALSRLKLTDGASICPLQLNQYRVDNHSDGAYTVLNFTAACNQAPQTLNVTYSLFFDLDPQHRGLLNMAGRTTVLSPDQPQQQFMLATAPNVTQQFFEFIKEGVWHIWTGFDHILFLVTLLLPAVLERKNQQWYAVANLRQAFGNVLKVVTAFTIAHSLTLALATLGVVELPSRLVESAIALSILVTAFNNFFPFINRRLWLVAFGFGLIHGFGFASVLKDLGLPQGSLLLSLVSFNIGVELGQLAIVAAFLPLAFALRTTPYYRPFALAGGSAVIAIMAMIWLTERLLDVSFLT